MVPRSLPTREMDGSVDPGSSTAETLKVLISGMFAISLSTVAASVLSQLNTGRLLPYFFLVVSCVLTVFACCITWAALLEAFGPGPHGAVVFLGLTLPLGSWFLIHANHEYWLLGPGMADVSVAEAGRHRYASSFRLRDARVATEFLGVRSVRQGGGRGHLPRTEWYYVAPVVYEGWTPEQPVTLWAAAPPNHYYSSLESWSKPHRAGVQLSSYELRYLREAVVNSEAEHGIKSFDGAPIIRWTPEPEAEVERARKFVLWVIAGNDLLLLLLFAGTSLAVRSRQRYLRVFHNRKGKDDFPRRRRMKILKQILGKPFQFGGENHIGWLPLGAIVPRPTPIENAVLDVRILDAEGRFFLEWESRNTNHLGDTWHETIEDAEYQAEYQFGIKPSEWEESG